MSARNESVCTHLVPGPYPFESVLVLDDYLGPTDWLVRCRDCAAAYLLEMLDLDGPRRLYRVRAPQAEAIAGLVRDLERGSCDLNRANAQAQHFTLASETLPLLMLLDLSAGTLNALLERKTQVEVDPQVDAVDREIDGTAEEKSEKAEEAIPSAGWRELPCDGSWIRRLI